MKKIFPFLLLASLLNIRVFSQSSLDFNSGKITCSDGIEISDGYFFLIRNRIKKDYGREKLAAFNAPYFINSANARTYTIDSIYLNCYRFTDSVKYLAFTPKVNSYLSHLLDSGHCGFYTSGVSISKLINPQIFYKIRPRDKYHKGDEMGFTYVKIKWLHLKVPDYVAISYFDFPYTLSQPYAKTKLYDIYIPIELLQSNNKVIVKNKKIIVNSTATEKKFFDDARKRNAP